MFLKPSIRTPLSLNPGDTIGVMAPSSTIDPGRFDAGVDLLKAAGYNIKIHEQTFASLHQSAGTVEQKVSAFHDLVKDPNIKAIMFASGGNRSAMMLPHLDMALIKRNAKIIMGFSDATSLLNGIHAKTGLITAHGPVVQSLPKITATSQQATLAALTGKYAALNGLSFQAGTAKGRLIGGTLSVFCALAGTGYMPSAKGSILFLEDINEEPSRLDRMLHHLRLALPFDHLSGIVIGGLMKLEETGRPFGFGVDDIIREHTQDLNIPVMAQAPFGHGDTLYPLPIGAMAKLEASQIQSRLEILL